MVVASEIFGLACNTQFSVVTDESGDGGEASWSQLWLWPWSNDCAGCMICICIYIYINIWILRTCCIWMVVGILTSFFFVVHFRPRFSQVETWRWWSRTGTEAKKLGWVWHCRIETSRKCWEIYIYTYTNLENWGGKCVKIYKPGLLVIQR